MDKSGQQETVETQSGNDGCSGRSWRRGTSTAVDNNDGNCGRQQWQMMKAADDDGT
jgi:hypothetical protein